MSDRLKSLEPIDRDLAVVIRELRATLGKMELALGSIDEAIVWTGEDGRVQWCNSTFDRLVGRAHLTVLGCPLASLLPLQKEGTELPEAGHPVYRVLSGDFATEEYEYRSDGEAIVLEIAGAFVQMKNGDPAAVLTIRDITERRRMESALLSANRTMTEYLREVDKVIGAAIAIENDTFEPESLHEVAGRGDELGRLARVFTRVVTQLKARERELADAKEQLEAVLNAVPGSISWIDSGGLFVGVNRHLAENFNLSQEAFIGQEVGFLQENAKLARFLNEFITGDRDSANSIIDFEIDRQKRYYLIAARKYQQGSATVSVGIDVTDRKLAEEALRIAEENYRSIFENALEGIFQSSTEGKYINVNPAMAKIYGYDSPREMLDSIADILTQVYVDPLDRADFQRLVEEFDRVKNFEYRAYRKDGEIIWVQEDTRAVRDSEGRLLYYEGMVQDITERKKREEELKRQLEELKVEIDQQKRKQEFSTLTKSTYFQEVRQEISEVNLDEFWS